MSSVKIYRISRKWKIFFAIAAAPLAALFGWLMIMPLLEGRSNETGFVLLCLLLGGGFMLFFLFALISVFKDRLEVHPEKIRDVCFLGTTELYLNDISGFRILPTQYVQMLIIQPKHSTAKKIKVALIIDHKEELLEWLNQNLVNLDSQEYQEEMDQLLSDPELGASEEQRLSLLNRAKRWSMILNGLAIVSSLWVLIRPQPYTYAIWTSISLPLIALFSLRYFNNVIKLNDKYQSAYPNVALAFIIPCLGLALRALSDFNILCWDHFWLPFLSFSLATFILVLFFAQDVRNKSGQLILLFLFCTIYGYSTVILLNGVLDRSSPSTYRANVIEKRISKGKHTSYYLKISPWGPRKGQEEIDVGRSIYNRYDTGDSVQIIVKQGRFEIPWFFVR